MAVPEALGAHGVTVRSTDGVAALGEYLNSDPTVPLVLDVRTDPSVSRPGFPPY